MKILRPHVLLLAALALTAGTALSQTLSSATSNLPVAVRQKPAIDTTQFQVVYRHDIRAKGFKRRAIYEMLQMGSSLYKYGGYGNYLCDSTIRAQNITKLSFNQSLQMRTRLKVQSEFLITDCPHKSMSFYGSVFTDHYLYTEDTPQMTWRLHPDTTATVCGQTCHKATATWRGRQWTAWYSDIPVDAGPWKFNGLPGLILQLEDATGDHRFTATALRQLREPICDERDQTHYIKTTRAKYNAALSDFKSESWKALAASSLAPQNADGTKAKLPKGKLFFNPIELE